MQSIGLATSTDLWEWKKHPANPVLEPDPRGYWLRVAGNGSFVEVFLAEVLVRQCVW